MFRVSHGISQTTVFYPCSVGGTNTFGKCQMLSMSATSLFSETFRNIKDDHS